MANTTSSEDITMKAEKDIAYDADVFMDLALRSKENAKECFAESRASMKMADKYMEMAMSMYMRAKWHLYDAKQYEKLASYKTRKRKE